MKEEKFFETMIKSADVKINAPEQTKTKVYHELQYELNKEDLICSFYKNYFLGRILKLSVPITILITICTGISAA